MTSMLLTAIIILCAACAVFWRLWRSADLRAVEAQKATQTAENRRQRVREELGHCRNRIAALSALHRKQLAHLQDESDRRAIISEAAAETRAKLDAVGADDLQAAADAMNARMSK